MYFVVLLAFAGHELGPYWPYPGPLWAMLGHFGPCWQHVGLVLSHFSGILLFVLAFVGQELGPC